MGCITQVPNGLMTLYKAQTASVQSYPFLKAHQYNEVFCKKGNNMWNVANVIYLGKNTFHQSIPFNKIKYIFGFGMTTTQGIRIFLHDAA